MDKVIEKKALKADIKLSLESLCANCNSMRSIVNESSEVSIEQTGILIEISNRAQNDLNLLTALLNKVD